jgi:hypothetical protein
VANKSAMQRKWGLQNIKKLDNITTQHENKTMTLQKLKDKGRI